MTLTLTAHDANQEAKDFFAKVAQLQGRVVQIKYGKDNSTATYTAYVPDQPELTYDRNSLPRTKL